MLREVSSDVASARERDPAARGIGTLEILTGWAGVQALLAHRVAHALWEAGDPHSAIAALETALKNGEPDRDIRIRLGLYLAESGIDPPRAIALLEHMPEDDVEALNGLGVAGRG